MLLLAVSTYFAGKSPPLASPGRRGMSLQPFASYSFDSDYSLCGSVPLTAFTIHLLLLAVSTCFAGESPPLALPGYPGYRVKYSKEPDNPTKAPSLAKQGALSALTSEFISTFKSVQMDRFLKKIRIDESVGETSTLDQGVSCEEGNSAEIREKLSVYDCAPT